MSNDDNVTIDVGSWAMTLVRNWWIIIGLIIVGVVVGVVFTKMQPKEYTATSSVYIGQTTDANGNAMAGLNSNSKAATELLSSQVVLDEAAKAVGHGMTSGKLRRSTTVVTPSSTVKTSTSVVNIVVISVTTTSKVKSAAAANALAHALLAHLDTGTNQKIALLQQQLTQGQQQLSIAQAQMATAQKAINAIARGGGSQAEKATAAAPYVAVVQAASTDAATQISDNQKTQLLLITAKQVEQPQLLHAAALPDSPSGPSTTMNVAVGALVGLVIGIIVAFARRGLAERRAAKASAAA